MKQIRKRHGRQHQLVRLMQGTRPFPWRAYTRRQGEGRIPRYPTWQYWRWVAEQLAWRRWGSRAQFACGVCFRPLYSAGYLEMLRSSGGTPLHITLCDDCYYLFLGLVRQAAVEPPWRESKEPGPEWYVKRYLGGRAE